jgi:hypothetical protein
MPRATITVGRDTDSGGWVELPVVVQGRVSENSDPDAYHWRVEDVEVVERGEVEEDGRVTVYVEDVGDLTRWELQRAEDCLIAEHEREQMEAAA